MKLMNWVVFLFAIFFSLTASAAGQHAGGHGHHGSPIGELGSAAAVTQTIQVEMLDTMRFSPASFSVKQGQTVRFVIKNAGQLKHEFVMGTKKDLDAHYELMKKHPHMEHAEDNMLSLEAGKSGELIWKFTQAGTVDVACLFPGHYDAGMKAAIKVGSVASK